MVKDRTVGGEGDGGRLQGKGTEHGAGKRKGKGSGKSIWTRERPTEMGNEIFVLWEKGQTTKGQRTEKGTRA